MCWKAVIFQPRHELKFFLSWNIFTRFGSAQTVITRAIDLSTIGIAKFTNLHKFKTLLWINLNFGESNKLPLTCAFSHIKCYRGNT